jgi:hypothetical protein
MKIAKYQGIRMAKRGLKKGGEYPNMENNRKRETMDEFDYSKLWEEEEQKEEKRIQRAIQRFPKGVPRKNLKGRYTNGKEIALKEE